MPWLPRFLMRSTRSGNSAFRFFSSTRHQAGLQPVVKLPTWDLEKFRETAFVPAMPAQLPIEPDNLPPACQKWFIHNANPKHSFTNQEEEEEEEDPPVQSTVNSTFWIQHENLLAPLELLTKKPNSDETSFTRADAPLRLLLSNISTPSPTHHLYLAQWSLSSLPPSLMSDLPTPALVQRSGRGDIYDSSLWLGRAPTYTPLHRDPNPNLLLQLAGRKTIRLFPPEVGRAIFDRVQEEMMMMMMDRSSPSSSSLSAPSNPVFRGEEMMQGVEKELLERQVWNDNLIDHHHDSNNDNDDDDGPNLDSASSLEAEAHALRQRYGYEAHIGLGEALFIPKGWWHSVKGVGEGVTASANWWFR